MSSVSLANLVMQESSELGHMLAMLAEQARFVDSVQVDPADIELLAGPAGDPFRVQEDNVEAYGYYIEKLPCLDIPGIHYIESFRPVEDMAHLDNCAEVIKANRKAHEQAMRSTFVKTLDAYHKQFVAAVKEVLQGITSMTDLYDLISVCAEHDAKLKKLAGRDFCDTFANLAFDFFHAEDRIRGKKKAKGYVVTSAYGQKIAQKATA